MITIQDLLDDRSIWNDWTISKELACELASFLEREKPKVIVETGSGISTLILARYAREYNAKVYSFEHEAKYAHETKAMLRRLGLHKHAEIRRRPLSQSPDGPFYNVIAPDNIDFLLIDGPPMKFGRQAVLPRLIKKLAPNYTAWLDDADRPHEQECLEQWHKDFHISYEITRATPKGLAIIREFMPVVPPRVDASDVTVTLLTGHRPELLDATLQSLRSKCSSFLETAHVIAYHNGSDQGTKDILDKYDDLIDDRFTNKETERWEGRATSTLMAKALLVDRPYIVHLEDDWVFGTTDHDWLKRAKAILDTYPKIGQVRLRHRGEKVLDRNQHSRRRVKWRDYGNHLILDGHYTFNPSLITKKLAKKIYPTDTESSAQQSFYGLDLKAAQISPGVFHHIGGGQSLRAKKAI